jgi:hypothetical protein
MARSSGKLIKEKNDAYQKNLDKRGNVPNSLTVSS